MQNILAKQSVWNASMKYDIAFPCATQNEIDQEMAQNLVENCEIKALFEGANMPSTDEAIEIYKEKNILYGLGKLQMLEGCCFCIRNGSKCPKRTMVCRRS